MYSVQSAQASLANPNLNTGSTDHSWEMAPWAKRLPGNSEVWISSSPVKKPGGQHAYNLSAQEVAAGDLWLKLGSLAKLK